MFALLAAAVLMAQASEVRRIPAPDADQGVATRGHALYAVSNHAIARIDAASGREVKRWDGDPALFPHINSCTADGAMLVCAASNFPAVPMDSRLERFDAKTLAHLSTQPLGHGHGSLTWAVRRGDGWWLCYANYDGHGGESGRDHRSTTLVHADAGFRELAQYRFPDDILGRMAPKSASGGVWGADGLLYVTGHDRPELYVLRVPAAGDVLEHVATVAIPTGGQAIAWDAHDPRLLWSIERRTRELVASRIPVIDAR